MVNSIVNSIVNIIVNIIVNFIVSIIVNIIVNIIVITLDDMITNLLQLNVTHIFHSSSTVLQSGMCRLRIRSFIRQSYTKSLAPI